MALCGELAGFFDEGFRFLPHLQQQSFKLAKGRMGWQETASATDAADGVLVTPEEIDIVDSSLQKRSRVAENRCRFG